VELSRWAAGIARDRFKLDVFIGRLEEARYPAGHFDAVVMSDIIEHLSDPRGTLAEAARILKPDGILCVSTPDINSLASRLLKARWWGVNMAHIFYFSRRSLEAMLNSAGFYTAQCPQPRAHFQHQIPRSTAGKVFAPACRFTCRRRENFAAAGQAPDRKPGRPGRSVCQKENMRARPGPGGKKMTTIPL
ncbi:MAG: class I SAM-dependent methyltransferase, partial [Kiritimatiellia bacterium]